MRCSQTQHNIYC